MRCICTSIVATLVLAGTAFAVTINVPGDHATIQGAIDASSNGDVIAIAAGTYNEHSLNPNGKAITIGSASGNPDVTINANGGGSVFLINSGETSGTVIKDLVITGGNGTDLGSDGEDLVGGGIYCYVSSPTISGCTIEGNTPSYGGGIQCFYNSNPTITDCTISGNTANVGGGIGCDYYCNPTISNCTISDNTANDRGGGIICNGCSPTITGCTITGNTADNLGGGIYSNNGSSPTITDCTISNNTATADGGGVFCIESIPTITGCTFTSNMPDTIVGDFNTGEPAPPTGACCLNGTCITATESDCTAAGGTYAGDDVACADAGCSTPPVIGACCVSSGCVANSNDDCTALGGTWLGEDASCDDCPATCMGDTDGNGVVNIEDLLNVLGNWGPCP